MLKDQLKREIANVVGGDADIKITEPERRENGDYTTNVAFLIAKKSGKSPSDIAEDLAHKLRAGKSELVDRAEAVGGFLNIWIKDKVLIDKIGEELKFEKRKEKINLEFISANPTGPLTMANGRGGFYGDVLANVLKKTGYDVTREYYINDAGNQIKNLEETISGKAEHYKGKYVEELKGKTGEEAIGILLEQIKKSLEIAGIKFDVWFSEKKIRQAGELEKVLGLLKEKKLVEEKDGATWLGDNVLIKSDGEATYFLADLAYHYDKFLKRKFDIAIDIWGADHHGYIERMQRGMEAIGVDKEKLKIIIMQLVRLVSKGKEVKMSKRAGEFVTMDELLEQVGVDAARWFFLERSPNTHMDFDLDLAKEKSEKNPVYYVQYAHTRMASILRNSKLQETNPKSGGFKNEVERDLALKILRFREILEDISKDFQVHRITTYAYELAQTFSAFYRDVKVVGSERERELLYLVSRAKETLADVLATLGISQPEKM